MNSCKIMPEKVSRICRAIGMIVVISILVGILGGCMLARSSGDDGNDDGKLFVCEFRDNDDRRENWTWSRGLWEVITEGQDAGAIVEKDGGEAYIYHKEFTLPDTFKITAQINLDGDVSKSNLWGGILFNYQSDNEFYLVRFKAGHSDVQLAVGKYVPGQSISLSGVLHEKVEKPLPSGEYVDFVLRRYSDRIHVTLDDQEVVFYTSSVSTGGKVGFYAGSKPGGGASPFYFKGLVVEAL